MCVCVCVCVCVRAFLCVCVCALICVVHKIFIVINNVAEIKKENGRKFHRLGQGKPSHMALNNFNACLTPLGNIL